MGHANLGAKFRGGVPWPARIEEDRARECDHVGIAGRDDRFGLIEAADQPEAITGICTTDLTARASGT